MAPPGWIAREVGLLLAAGVPADRAPAGPSWAACGYLGEPGIAGGAPADLVRYAEDPSGSAEAPPRPVLIMLAGRVARKT